ncbi:MAG: hypothetical protein U5R14_14735 [Gemmatimonadota bacterium]|nr:hypothetical protein [Gemmatimonadota bacterium]
MAYSASSPQVQRQPFQLEWVINQGFQIDSYQPLLFVVDSFDHLFALVEELEDWAPPRQARQRRPRRPRRQRRPAPRIHERRRMTQPPRLGDPAPPLDLPTLDGGRVALDGPRDRAGHHLVPPPRRLTRSAARIS